MNLKLQNSCRMLMLQLLVCASMLGAVVLLGACKAKDPVREDLIKYLDVELPGIIAYEKQAGNDFTQVTGENYKGDAAMLSALENKVIPEYGKFLTGLKAIEPQTEDVQRIHDKYIVAATEINNGFAFLADGLKKQNQDAVVRGNFMVDDGAAKVREVNRQIGVLARSHDIAIDTVVPGN